jgi:hypothetical protein
MTTAARSYVGWIAFCAFLVVAGQILDSVTFAQFFLIVPPDAVLAEQNPVTRTLMEIGGPTLVSAAKLGIAYRIWRGVPKLSFMVGGPRRLLRVLLPVAAVSGFVGAAFNTYAIAQLLGW